MRWIGLLLILLLGGCRMDVLTPVKLYPGTYSDGVLAPAIIYHPASGKYVVLFWEGDVYNAGLRGAVITGEGTIGTVSSGNRASRGMSLIANAVYDAYSQKIIVIGDKDVRNRTFFMVSVTGDTVSIDSAYIAVSEIGLTDYGPIATFDNGFLVVMDYNAVTVGPRFELYSVNQSTGEPTYVSYSDNFPPVLGRPQILGMNTKALVTIDDRGGGRKAFWAYKAGSSVAFTANTTIRSSNASGYIYGNMVKINDELVGHVFCGGGSNTEIYIQLLAISGFSVTVQKELHITNDSKAMAYPVLSYDAVSQRLIVLYRDNNVLLTANVYDMDLNLIEGDFVIAATSMSSDFYLGDLGQHIVYIPDQDRYVAVFDYEEDDPLDYRHLYLGGLGDVKPLFWTNWRGQTETK